MDSQHTPVAPERTKRRRVDLWDRIKILFILGIVIGVILWTKVNAPFTDFGDAISEMTRETLGGTLLVLFMVEILRQLHYLVAERSAGYNMFWQERVFGGAERQLHKRTKPWTRFRVGRLFRLALVVFLYGTIVSLFASDISNPVQAITETPRLIGQFMFFIVYAIFIFTIVVGQFVAIFWFLSRGGVDVVLPEEIETRYTDVWGQDHVLELVKENVGFLEKPDEIEEKGGYIPGGILLWGPPGTGKTLIAQATAGEVGVPFVFVEPGAFINMFMGVGILKVKSLFRKLRKISLRHGGVVVFFDEADALGSRGALAGGGGPPQPAAPFSGRFQCNGFSYLSDHARSIVMDDTAPPPSAEGEGSGRGGLIHRVIMGGMGMGGGGMGTLQALLTEMSGLQKPRGLFNKIRKTMGLRPKPAPKYRIFIMMATNLPSVLDPALLRPGRIDRIYKVGYPTKEGRARTLTGYLAKVQHSLTPSQIDELAVKTPYYSGAKIKDLINEALILALRDDREVVTWDDIWKAKNLKEMGPAEGFEYVDREEFAVAIHEASHAVALHLLDAGHDIDIATIERRGETGGFVSYIAIEDRFAQWKSELEVDVKTSLASLAGERIFFDADNSMGVGGDLQSATSVVSRMVGVWGMGDTIASMSGMPRHALDQPPDPTDKISQSMRSQVEARLQSLYNEVHALLVDHKAAVFNVAVRLQEKKTISGQEVAEIIGIDAGAVTKQSPRGFGALGVDHHRELLGIPAETSEKVAASVDGGQESVESAVAPGGDAESANREADASHQTSSATDAAESD